MGYDIKGPEPTAQEVVESKRSTIQDVQQAGGNKEDALRMNKDYVAMADFLGLNKVDRIDYDIMGKVSFIRDFTKAETEADAMLKINKIARHLGINLKGKELVNNIYKYARLYHERSELDKEIEAYTGEKNIEKPKINRQAKALKNKLEKVLEEKKRLAKKVRELSRSQRQTYVQPTYW